MISGSNTEHSLLSPSGSKKWLGCPASLICEADIPNTSGKAAVQGTAMHLLAETLINRIIKNDYPVRAGSYKGSYVLNEGKGPIKSLVKVKPGAVLINDDFVKQVDSYVDYCRPIIDSAEMVEVESRVNLTRVLHHGAEVNGSPLKTFGTADLVAVMPGGLMIVGDLKTGRHKVSAKQNKQMMVYALGLLAKYSRVYDITSVRLVIFQPYAGGADEWDVSVEELNVFKEEASKGALRAIDAYNRGKKALTASDFNPSADACQWCRFADKCNAKRKVANKEVEEDLADEAVELTIEQIKAEYDKLPLMRQHIADIEKAMFNALMNGAKVEGLKLVEGRAGNRSWTDEAVVIARFGDKVMTESVMTPTAAMKAIPEDELAEFITRKPGQPSIATADDKRPEWKSVTDGDLA